MSPQSRRLALLFWWTIPVSSVILFIFLGFGEDASKEYGKFGEAIMSTIPSRVLPGRNGEFGKGMVLVSTLPSSRLRFALFQCHSLTSLTFSNAAPPKTSRHTLRTLLTLPRQCQHVSQRRPPISKSLSSLCPLPRPPRLHLESHPRSLSRTLSARSNLHDPPRARGSPTRHSTSTQTPHTPRQFTLKTLNFQCRTTASRLVSHLLRFRQTRQRRADRSRSCHPFDLSNHYVP